MITFYKIYCLDENITDCYIGSTKNLDSRKQSHKIACTNPKIRHYGIKVYKFIRENGGLENWNFKILNMVEYFNIEMKLKMEQVYIDYYRPSLNTICASRTIEQCNNKNKEYYKKNVEKIKDQAKEYRKKNVEKVKEFKKLYSKKNKEKIDSKNKEYYINNKEHIDKQTREYYQNNKEKISEYRKEKYEKNKEHKNISIL